jgi:hypothetical protein
VEEKRTLSDKIEPGKSVNLYLTETQTIWLLDDISGVGFIISISSSRFLFGKGRPEAQETMKRNEKYREVSKILFIN